MRIGLKKKKKKVKDMNLTFLEQCHCNFLFTLTVVFKNVCTTGNFIIH